MCSILEDPCICRLTGPRSPDTKVQLSHWTEVFSSIRHTCRSPKYSSTVSLGCKWHETNVSSAKTTRRACFTCCKSSLWSWVNRRYTDRAPFLSLSGRTRLTLSTPHILHTSSTCFNHSDAAICVWLHICWNSFYLSQALVLVGFRSLVEVESTYWALVKLLNLQNELMDVHQSDISKILCSCSLNLATSRGLMFSSIKQVTYLASFTSGFRMPVAERAHLLFLRSKIVTITMF